MGVRFSLILAWPSVAVGRGPPPHTRMRVAPLGHRAARPSRPTPLLSRCTRTWACSGCPACARPSPRTAPSSPSPWPPRRLREEGPNSVFSTAWNQNLAMDTLYVCIGPSQQAAKPLHSYAIHDLSTLGGRQQRRLTSGFNNAFPSSSPDGRRLVFRSTRDGGDKRYKNLYIMEDVTVGEFGTGKVTRLTNGAWTDTHCSWSPREGSDWIVFSSTRDKPAAALADDNGLDPGYFAVFLVRASDPTVVVRVIKSAETIAGHVNHPVFSPDGRSIAVTSDLAAVSADPISLPVFERSVRPYGNIFTVDIDPDDINKNKDIKAFHRVPHSRYENSTPAWTMFATDNPNAQWSTLVATKEAAAYRPACPYAYPHSSQSWHIENTSSPLSGF